MRSHRASVLLAATTLLLGAAPIARAQVRQAARDPRSTLLVSSAWLAQHLEDPDLVLLHVGDKAEYDAKHIAGARFVGMQDVSVSDHDANKMLEMPSNDSLRAMLERLGISDRSRVVVYYGNDWVSPTTRIAFTLEYAGLGAQTSVLDGGMKAWVRDGHETTAAVPSARVGTLAPLRTLPLIVDAAYVKAHIGARGISIVDGRTGEFYDGLRPGGMGSGGKSGHIVSAKSVPFNSVYDDRDVLRPAGELAQIFAKAGVQPGDTIVGYCHIGQQATAMLFAARSLGIPVVLYDGSFTQWSALGPEYPVESAPAKAKP